MELAAGAVRCVVSKLASLLVDEYNLQKGVRGEIRFLTEEMKMMQAVLDDLSKQSADSVSHVQKEWARDLKELSYDIEDSVDEFMLRVDDAHANPRNLTGFGKFIDKMGQIGNVMSVKEAMVRRRIAKEVEDIKTRVRVVADRKDRLTIPGATTQPDTKPIVDPRIHALFADVHSLVGIDGPAERLASLLTTHTEGQNQNLVVASIVGLGGLGKTTLAKAVYERLGSQFQCKAFVPVSLRPDLKRILMGILRQVGGTNDPTNDGEKYEHELIDDIKKYLSDKRYFIVIDDLWDEETWEYITHALVDNSCGSRVIVTTRNFKVAKSCATPAGGAPFELKPLSDADSKRLLYKRVFDKDGGNHTELDEVARKILKKCGGVPLAIITTASLLACKPRTKSEWYRVYRSLGPGLDKGKTKKNMPCYQELPSYLRPCLLYLSLFPEDLIIWKDRLVKLWVAEGLVVVDAQGGGNLYELYDRAEGYFNELVNRSFIRPLAIDDVDGDPNACSVHDVILDLLVSLSAEDNFVLRLDCQKVTPSTRRIRRLSLQNREVEVSVPETVDLSHVRSVIAFGDASKWVPPLLRFKFLRVLDLGLEGFPEINDHLKELRRLHHLRYLPLYGYLERQVLEEIGNLQHLKMLDLRRAFVSQLPASIVRLKNLQSLLVHDGTKMPQGIGSLSKLEEMEWIVVESNTAAELGKLTELRFLRVVVVDQTTYQAFLQSLSNLSNLLDLAVRCSRTYSLDDLSDLRRAPTRLRFFHVHRLTTFQQIPSWVSWLSELSVLNINVNNLTQDDLNMLGALTVLRCLELQVHVKGTIAQERLLIGSDQPFQSLQAFKFKHHARCWLVLSQGVMAKLEKLELYFQVSKRDDGVIDVGFGLENLTSLKYVTIEVDCYQANIMKVEDVETKLRDAFDAHPKKPDLNMYRINDYDMEQDETSSGRHQRDGGQTTMFWIQNGNFRDGVYRGKSCGEGKQHTK